MPCARLVLSQNLFSLPPTLSFSLYNTDLNVNTRVPPLTLLADNKRLVDAAG